MAFREKIAWLTLAAMLVAYGTYFLLFPTMVSHDTSSAQRIVHMVSLFGAVTFLQLVFVIVVSAVLAARASEEAHAKADERDRAIARRGSSVAYFVLMAGIILVGVVMPFRQSGLEIVNAALLALVLAEAVRYILVVLSYRRGWHG